MNDKFTDKLFQEGADRYDFEYNEAAWKQMEGLLDRDRQRRNLRRLLGALLFGILLLGSGFWWWKGTETTTPQLEVEQQSEAVRTTSEEQDVKVSAERGDSGSALRAAELAINNRVEIDKNSNAQTGDAPLSPPAKKSEVNSPLSLPVQPRSFDRLSTEFSRDSAGVTGQFRTKRVDSPKPSRSAGLSDPVLSGATPVTVPGSSGEAVGQLPRPAFFPVASEQPAFITVPESETVIAELLAGSLTHKGLTPPNNGLTAGLAYGRVHGGGGDENFSQGRNRFGLDLGYRFGKKFSVQTGAYYGELSYCAEGTDYTAPDGFWTDGIVARRVEADCRVLEIPLLFTFYPGGNAGNGLYLTGGVTSYFLLREDFNFLYDDPTHNGVSAWQEINTNRHLFGMGQLGVGFEQRVSRKMLWQLEAYGQLPLTGIGQGRVNLTNIGVSAKLLFDFRR